jgi:DNA-binding CsgD family transcriptional regulator
MDEKVDIPRLVLGTIEDLKQAEGLDVLSRRAAEGFLGLGLVAFAVAKVPVPNEGLSVEFLAGEYEAVGPLSFIAEPGAEALLAARELYITTRPFSWSEVIERHPADAAQTSFKDETGAWGDMDLLFTPLPWFTHSRVAVVLAGPSCCLDHPLIRTAAEVLSYSYGAEVRRLIPIVQNASPTLSRRQRECLTWVRHGKSSTAISQILGLSPDTIEEHISQACRKLGVRTRVQAVVEGCLAGLIK